MQKAFPPPLDEAIRYRVHTLPSKNNRSVFPRFFCLYATRRKVTRFLIGLGLASLVAADVSAQTAATSLRIGIVTPVTALTDAQRSTLEGIRLGATEAAQTARLFGAHVETFEASGDGPHRGAVRAAQFLSSARKVQVLVAVAPGDIDRVATFAEDHDLIFLDVTARDMSARKACRRHSFHVEASELMYSNAARQFAADRKAPSTPRATSSVALWDSHLERFGASQLNDRYAAAAKRGMDGHAWAGWAAIKIVSEAALRAGSADPTRIIAYLEAPTTQFDGHKGWPLSFRLTDHQLRQPLYIVVPTSAASAASSPRVIDIPDLRSVSAPGADDRSTVDALDRLSAGSTLRCAWSSR